MLRISATIITFNEADNIRAACESMAWADEIVVVDSKSTDNTREINESVKMDEGARVEILAGDLLHYTTDNPVEHKGMIEERYAPLGAQKMFEQGKRATNLKVATIGPATFIRSYVLKGGFRDGRAGFEIAKMAAYHARL